MNLYEKNIQIIKNRDPQLAQKIDSASSSNEDIEEFTAKNGTPSLKILSQGKKWIKLHSAYDPAVEAERFVKNMDVNKYDVIVFFGFGLGYHLLEAFKALRKNRFLIAVEPDERILKIAFQKTDLTELLSSHRFFIFSGKNPGLLGGDFSQFLEQYYVDKVHISTHRPYAQIYPRLFRMVEEEIKRTVNRRAVDIYTLIQLGTMFQKNFLRNIPIAANSQGVINLFNRFKKLPVILVAAGPSLDKNIDDIKLAKDRAVIIAVATALKPLLDHGIRPDIVTAIDPKKVSLKYLQELGDLSDIVLVVDMDVYPEIPRSYPGPRFFIEVQSNEGLWLRKFIGEKGFLKKGRTVAHTSLFLAKELGCDPIIFVGQDLAFPNFKTHVSGTADAWELKKKKGKKFIMVPSSQGGMVPTNTSFLSFISMFESEIAKLKATCIDATEGGALIRGTKIMTLKEAIEKHCKEEMNVKSIIKEIAEKKPEFDKEKFLTELSRLEKKLKIIIEKCRKGLYRTEELNTLYASRYKDIPKIQKNFHKCQKLHQELLEDSDILDLLIRGNVKSTIATVRVEHESFDIKDDTERLKKINEGEEEFFKGNKEAANIFLNEIVSLKKNLTN